MHRRHLLSALALSPLLSEFSNAAPPSSSRSLLEVKTWHLHNTPEEQAKRVSAYLEKGLLPALQRAGSKLVGAFGNLIGPDGPYLVTLAEYPSFAAFGQTLDALENDSEHHAALEQLGSGSGLPFVRVGSSLLRSFSVMPRVAVPTDLASRPNRVFELRTYESQTFATLAKKVGMFNNGEAQIFQRVGMRPVFFGETLAGERQPNLTYMLTYDSLAARDELWKTFVNDPEWKKLSGQPDLKDPLIVANISNILLRPLPFSSI